MCRVQDYSKVSILFVIVLVNGIDMNTSEDEIGIKMWGMDHQEKMCVGVILYANIICE